MNGIGIDTHKDSLAACAVDELGAVVAEATFPNDRAGHSTLGAWAHEVAPGARLGFEGSSTFGAAAARTLEQAGFEVREVPRHLPRRERLRTRRPGKSDLGDALAIARVTARETELPPIRRVDATTELGLLLAARADLIAEATRIRNRLHADLVVLVPGYGGRVANHVWERHLATAGRALADRIEQLVAGHPLLALSGSGPLTVATLVAEAGELDRFCSADSFAMLAGVAPIPASSQRMRLNRGGNRQLNRALHVIAVVQARVFPLAQQYIARKIATGRTWKDAIRSLKRQLARVVFRLLLRVGRKSEEQRLDG